MYIYIYTYRKSITWENPLNRITKRTRITWATLTPLVAATLFCDLPWRCRDDNAMGCPKNQKMLQKMLVDLWRQGANHICKQ